MNELAKRQLLRGCAVEVVSWPSSGDTSIYYKRKVRFVGFDIYGKGSTLFRLAPIKILRELNDFTFLTTFLKKIDVLHVHGPFYYLWPRLYRLGFSGWGVASKLSSNVGVVWTCHTEPDKVIKYFKAARMERSYAHVGTAPSKEVAKMLDCIHIPNGVDTKFFRPLNVDANLFKRRFCIREDDYLILCVSNWYPIKRIDLLVRIVGHLPENLRNKCHLFIAGYLNEKDPAMVEHYRRALKEARRLGVRFSTARLSREELLLAYNSADVSAHSSEAKGDPLAVIEAMSCGRPVVMFDIGSAYPLHGFNAFVAKNDEEFAKYLELLLTDENLRIRMGRNARETAIKFDWDIVVEKYLKIYESALEERNE